MKLCATELPTPASRHCVMWLNEILREIGGRRAPLSFTSVASASLRAEESYARVNLPGKPLRSPDSLITALASLQESVYVNRWEWETNARHGSGNGASVGS